MADPAVSRRFWLVAVFLGVLLAGAAFWGAQRDAFGLFHDDGIYAVVAKSLAQGDGYRIVSLPGGPAETKYPPLYSFLLSWFWRAASDFPANVAALKLLNIAVLLGIFLLAAAFYRRYFPGAGFGALVFALVVAANPIVFTFTDFALSDLLFVFLALAALVIFADESDGSFARIALLGGMVGFACLTRLAAAPLVLAGAVYAWQRRGWRSACGFVLIVGLFVAPWFVWVSHARLPAADSLYAYYAFYTPGKTGVSDFGAWIGQHAAIAFANARYLAGTFELLYLIPLLPALGPVLVALTAMGMFVSLRRAELVPWSFFLSSLALILFWPFHPGRYAAPLVPLLILFVFRGMKALDRWIDARAGESALALARKLVWIPALLIFVLSGVWLSGYLLIHDERTTRTVFGSRLPFAWSGFEESFAWIRRHVPDDALLATAYDPMYYLYTGRRAIRPALHRPDTYFYPYGAAQPDVGTVSDIQPQLEKLRVKFLIVDPMEGYAEGKATLRLFNALISAYGERANLVFTSSDGQHKIYALAEP